MLAMCIVFLAGTIAAIIFATPWFALVVLPLTLVYWRVMNYFRNVSREVKRMDSLLRSPVYAHFSETLGGLSVIRAYGLVRPFAAQNEAKVSSNISAYYTLKSCDRWLSIRLEVLGNVIVLANALLAVGTAASMSRTGSSAAGIAGFSLSYALSITGMLNWTVRTAADTEQQMNSVERICYYPDTVKPEPYEPKARGAAVAGADGALVAAPAPPAAWPATGSIEFRDYRMRYRPGTPEVLHGVNFAVAGGEKVGIVGRTGSGKSSIMVSLFRLVDEACHSGRIAVDGVDIDTLGLARLRRELAIIPQDPTLFSGTLRTNLDPTGALTAVGHTPAEADAQLWSALERVGLKGVVEAMPGKLDAAVSEFGENLSVGQRQLLCLARVLLRRCRIVLLDEATSSVDFATDQLMQASIRSSFGHCTILTIAHRLNTVINSDKVLVMDGGLAAEFDHPHVLLSRPDSAFSALVEEMGPAAAAALRAKAAEAYAARGAGFSSSAGGSSGTPAAIAAAETAVAGELADTPRASVSGGPAVA
jgi:ABC-type multidrug transport system fused ATPase/permease subunit